MNLENKITQIFSTEEIIPSVGQGVIALHVEKMIMNNFTLNKIR